jgi:hypothetical protein
MPDLVSKYGPGAVGLAVLAYIFLRALSSAGFVDDVVHVSVFERFKIENAAEHSAIRTRMDGLNERTREKLDDIGRDVDSIKRANSGIAGALQRIEAQTKPR